MTGNNLAEPSFADAVATIEAAPELPEQKRRHWATSLRQTARAMDKPLEQIPARLAAVRADLDRLHAAPSGMTPKTLRNHKSNTRRALLWLQQHKDIARRGEPLTGDWEQLRANLSTPVRARLSSFIRFCSANGITPGEVDEAAVDLFMTVRTQSGHSADDAFRRLLARAWNANIDTVPGWPACPLREPPVKAAMQLAWTDFPDGLRRDREQYNR